MRIDSNGNMGIGTDNPGFDFHLYRTGDTTLVIESDRPNSDENANPKLVFRQDGGVSASAIGMNFDSDGVGNDLFIANSISSGSIRFLTGSTNGYTNATEKLRITSGGDVGIGTDNPTSKVDILGDGVRIISTATNAGSGEILLGTNGNNNRPSILIGSSGTPQEFKNCKCWSLSCWYNYFLQIFLLLLTIQKDFV